MARRCLWVRFVRAREAFERARVGWGGDVERGTREGTERETTRLTRERASSRAGRAQTGGCKNSKPRKRRFLT
jgi:hypothetical protein